MRIPKEVKKAQQLALAGKLHEALPIIRKNFESGNMLACITLAELYGLEKDWTECFYFASHYLLFANITANPLNLYIECVQLIAASCTEEPGLFPSALNLIAIARGKIEESMADVSSSGIVEHLVNESVFSMAEVEPVFNSLRAYGIQSYSRYLNELQSFIETGDYEGVFYRFERPRIALNRLPVEGDTFSEMELSNLAKCLIKAGNRDEAWSAIKTFLKNWRPISLYMVLPARLVTDPTLRAFVNADHVFSIMIEQDAQ